MTSTLFMRIGSAFGALFTIGHSMGAPWTPTNDPAATAVVDHMKAVHFPAMGTDRTYWDFYFGFGLSGSVYLAALAIVLWLLGNLAKAGGTAARPFLITLFLAYAAITLLSVKYFFAAPLILGSLVCLCIVLAIWKLER